MRRTVPRGRHAPPLEVRQGLQRDRLTEAAIALLEENIPLTAEGISRMAGMSKATFYELFANVEDFIPAVLAAIRQEADTGVSSSAAMQVRRAVAEAGVAISRAQAERVAVSLELLTTSLAAA